MPYIFDLTVKDNLWKDSFIFMVLFTIFVFVITQIESIFMVKNNWDRMRCRPEVMAFAWLYGKNTANTMEYCLENAGKQVKQSNIVNPAKVYIQSLNDKTKVELGVTKENLKDLTNKIQSSSLTVSNKTKEIATGLQSNILALKESMQKIIAGLVIQNRVSNGVFKTTNGTKMLTESLRKSIDKVYPKLAEGPTPGPTPGPTGSNPVNQQKS